MPFGIKHEELTLSWHCLPLPLVFQVLFQTTSQMFYLTVLPQSKATINQTFRERAEAGVSVDADSSCELQHFTHAQNALLFLVLHTSLGIYSCLSNWYIKDQLKSLRLMYGIFLQLCKGKKLLLLLSHIASTFLTITEATARALLADAQS